MKPNSKNIQPSPLQVKQGTNAAQYFYTYTDHLGSIVAVTNGTGVVQGRQSFDAFGRARNPAAWNDYTTIPSITLNGFVLDRGYTGHQHLKEFGIINMNGRLYDPIVGRMLNVDNFVQDPSSTQAFNRYSYVVNNPLKYTDPSGWKGIWKGPGEGCDYDNGRDGLSGRFRAWVRNLVDGSSGLGNNIEGVTYIWLNDRGAIGGEGWSGYNHSPDSYAHGSAGSFSGNLNGKNDGGYTKPQDTKSNNFIRANHEKELSTNTFGSITFVDWIAKYNGLTLNKLLIEAGETKQGFPKGPSFRFVKDPLYEGVIIDMKHFLIALKYGVSITDAWEERQHKKGNESGYNPQDYYSNNLGLAFRTYIIDTYPLFGEQKYTFNDILLNLNIVEYINHFFSYFTIRIDYE